MNTKNTWTLLALAAGLFAFIFFFERHSRTTGEVRLFEPVLREFNPETVTSVQIRPEGQLEIRAEKSSGAWRLSKPLDYPADAGAVERLLQALKGLEWHTHITARELKDRPQAETEFGFETPRYSLIIQQNDTRTQIQIGSRTVMGDQVFLQVVGREGIYVVGAEWLPLLPGSPNDWRDTRLAVLKDLPFDRLSVTSDGKTFELQRDPGGKPWRMSRPMPARADSPKIDALLSKLQELRVTRFVTDETNASLEPFGLRPPELELAFSQGTNQLLALQFGKSPTNEQDLVYARRQGQPGAVLLPRQGLDAWRAPHTEFRNRNLIGLVEQGVDLVESRGEEPFTLQRVTNGTWRVTDPHAWPADTELVREYLGALADLKISQFVKDVVTELDLPTYGLAPPARQIILKGASPGGDTNAVIAQLEIGGAQGGKVFVRRTDPGSLETNSVYAVSLAGYEKLPAAAWQLRDRRIWKFTTNDVARLSVRNRGQTRELVRSGPAQWALSPGSTGVINELAIEEIVHRLGNLTAAVWVDRGEEALPRYGFTESSYRLSLELRQGEKPLTLEVVFGALAPSEFPYASVTLDGQRWIFEFPLDLYFLALHYLGIPDAAAP